MDDCEEQMSIDLIKENAFIRDMYSSKESHKRCLNSNESHNKKRISCDDHLKYNSQTTPVYRVSDTRNIGKEEEEYDDSEESELDQQLRQLSHRLINFDLNYVPLDWDFKDTTDSNTIDVFPQSKRLLSEVKFPPETGQQIHGYQLQTLVTNNKRTAVFIGFNVKKPTEEVIIKIGFEKGFVSIQNESFNYLKLKTSTAVPRLVDYLWWKVYREDYTSIRWGFIILEKCGHNLVDLMKSSTLGLLPIEETREIAIRMITVIEKLHEKGFLHSSLKPEHFILDSEDKPDLKLIGLNASKTYLKKSSDGNMVHIEELKNRRLPKCDPTFHSIGYHNGYQLSRRDDMESLGYCIIYLVKGVLPWMDSSLTDFRSQKVIHSIGKRKQKTTLEDLCSGLTPDFRRYFESIEKYGFTDKPDYEQLRQCFRLNAQLT